MAPFWGRICFFVKGMFQFMLEPVESTVVVGFSIAGQGRWSRSPENHNADLIDMLFQVGVVCAA